MIFHNVTPDLKFDVIEVNKIQRCIWTSRWCWFLDQCDISNNQSMVPTILSKIVEFYCAHIGFVSTFLWIMYFQCCCSVYFVKHIISKRSAISTSPLFSLSHNMEKQARAKWYSGFEYFIGFHCNEIKFSETYGLTELLHGYVLRFIVSDFKKYMLFGMLKYLRRHLWCCKDI